MVSAKLEWKVDTSGIDDALATLPQHKGRFMDALAERAVELMDLSFNTSPNGRSHDRGKGRVHIASQPGYPPNKDSGTLALSLRWERRGADVREIHGVEYALDLEDSTMLNRPFIGPAIAEMQGDVPALGKQFLRIGE